MEHSWYFVNVFVRECDKYNTTRIPVFSPWVLVHPSESEKEDGKWANRIRALIEAAARSGFNLRSVQGFPLSIKRLASGRGQHWRWLQIKLNRKEADNQLNGR